MDISEQQNLRVEAALQAILPEFEGLTVTLVVGADAHTASLSTNGEARTAAHMLRAAAGALEAVAREKDKCRT